MSDEPGYHNRQRALAANIRGLLCYLNPSTYGEIAPKVKYWIEYVLREGFTTTDDLAERVSSVAWGSNSSCASIARFLKEFSNGPRRSEQARPFVGRLCDHVLRWFAITSVENLSNRHRGSKVVIGDGEEFIRAASFVGHLIESGLLDHDLVRRHLVKPLIVYHYPNYNHPTKSVRANAIYQLLIAAGETLLQGLLEPEDVKVCFEVLDTGFHGSTPGVAELDVAKLNVRCECRLDASHYNLTADQELRELHATWLQRKEEEDRRAIETETEDRAGAEVSTEIKTPIAFVPQDLCIDPIAFVPQDLCADPIDIGVPSPALQGIVPTPILHDVETSSDPFVGIATDTISSPTLSISTVSDLTTTKLGEDIGEGSDERTATRHETFYFEDGNVEVVSGATVFRVHSSVVSLSSPKLRDILSQSGLLRAQTSEKPPRISVTDSAVDFAALLKMIYMPGWVSPVIYASSVN